jgi:cell division septation protein DedD
MDNLNFEDDFEREYTILDRMLKNKGKLAAAFLVFSLVSLTTFLYFNYLEAYEEVPVIEDSTLSKVKPDDPGGMEVPNQDKTIYDSFASSREETQEEKLLDSSEEPVEPGSSRNSASEADSKNYAYTKHSGTSSELASSEKSEGPESQAKAEADKPVKEAGQEKQFSAAVKKNDREVPAGSANNSSDQFGNSASANKSERQITPDKTYSENSAREAGYKTTNYVKDASAGEQINSSKKTGEASYNREGSASPESGKKAISRSTKTGQKFYRVQVTSLRSEAAVEKHLERLKSTYGELLSGHETKISTKEIPDKGKFYRLQIGEFKNFKEAYEYCRKLKQNNFRCIVIKD